MPPAPSSGIRTPVALQDDVHLRAGLNVCAGQITCEPVAQAHGMAFVPAESMLG